MKCPHCKEDKNRVVDTRGTRRTRKCTECGHSFVTAEGYDVGNVWVKKRDGTRQVFSREQLYDSIKKAAVREIPVAEVQGLVDHVIAELFSKEMLFFSRADGKEWADTTTVTTRQIGNAVMAVLHARTRYRATRIRYALLFESSYGAFRDAKTFASWLATSHSLDSDAHATGSTRWVVKRSGERHPYEQKKLADSIMFAVRKRPVTDDKPSERDNKALVTTIVHEVERLLRNQSTVTSGQIALATMQVLQHASDGSELDKLMGRGERELAYLRVASSAKHFTQIEDFLAEAHYVGQRTGRRSSSQ